MDILDTIGRRTAHQTRPAPICGTETRDGYICLPLPRRVTYSAIGRVLGIDRSTVRLAVTNGRIVIGAMIAYDPLLRMSKTQLAQQLGVSRVTLHKALKRQQITWENGQPVYTPQPVGRPRKDGQR